MVQLTNQGIKLEGNPRIQINLRTIKIHVLRGGMKELGNIHKQKKATVTFSNISI